MPFSDLRNICSKFTVCKKRKKKIQADNYSANTKVFKRLKDLSKFKQDLKNAEIDYINERGEYLDFHSFRDIHIVLFWF